MSITLTSREFNQDSGRAKRAAESGPVIITDRGKPSHVLLSYAEYQRLAGPKLSIADALAQKEGPYFEFEPPRLCTGLPKILEFD